MWFYVSYKQNYLLLRYNSEILQKYEGEMCLYHAKLAPLLRDVIQLIKKG